MEIKHFVSQKNLESIENKLVVEIPEEVVKLLNWKQSDRVQISLTENGVVQLRNFDSTVQNSFKKLEDEVLHEVRSYIPNGYQIRSWRELQSSNGYEISVDKPASIRHSDLRDFVNNVNNTAKKFKLRIEVV